MKSNLRTLTLATAVLLAALAGSAIVQAQQPATPKPNIVMKQDAESLPGKELALSLVEFPPGSAEVPHTHPAELMVFVREGEVVVENEGKPNATYKAGQAFYVPANKIHRVMNTTGETSRTAAFFVAEKGKPLTTPAAK